MKKIWERCRCHYEVLRRTFNRYRAVDIDMKKDLVKILEGKQ